ncbi:hypothetical protein TNCV_2600031 [Trichonephila clavipes]|nr:hypothetical protein TNCV_2600031 [Trichonephila clavipes]
MVSLGHPSLPPTYLDRQDDEEATPGCRSLQPITKHWILELLQNHDHQTAKLPKGEQNMTILMENNVPVLLAKSVCDLCPILRTRTFGTFALVL